MIGYVLKKKKRNTMRNMFPGFDTMLFGLSYHIPEHHYLTTHYCETWFSSHASGHQTHDINMKFPLGLNTTLGQM